MPYFTQLSRYDDPGKQEIHEFLHAARNFLSDLLSSELKLDRAQSEATPQLLTELGPDALDVFRQFVEQRFDELHESIERAEPDVLRAAGVIGTELSLRYRDLAAIEELPNNRRAYWPQVAAMLQQADLTLDSTLDPLKRLVPGIGEFVSQFKQYRLTLFKLVTG